MSAKSHPSSQHHPRIGQRNFSGWALVAEWLSHWLPTTRNLSRTLPTAKFYPGNSATHLELQSFGRKTKVILTSMMNGQKKLIDANGRQSSPRRSWEGSDGREHINIHWRGAFEKIPNFFAGWTQTRRRRPTNPTGPGDFSDCLCSTPIQTERCFLILYVAIKFVYRYIFCYKGCTLW